MGGPLPNCQSTDESPNFSEDMEKNSEPAFEWVRTLNPSNEQEQQILNSVLKNLEGRKYGEQ